MFNLFRSRDKVVRYMLTGLLAVVALSMVTYLIPSSGVDPGNNADNSVVAVVGKDQLTAQQVSKAIQNVTRSRNLPPDLLAIYVPQIVQQMISERAMAYEAGRLGMQVSSDETENAILDSLPPELLKGGKVDSATLSAVLQQQGVTMADLKDDTARQLLVSRLRQIVGEGVIVSPGEIENEFHHRKDKVKIEYALLTPARYQAESEPTDSEVRSYYDAHKSTFQTAEKRSLGIIVLDQAQVHPTLPSDADLQRDYRANQEKFKTPERVDARHILIKSDASNDAAMKAKAEGILKQIQGGGDFAKLARENSQDPGSAEKGGELGWIVRGQTVPEFEKAAFSLQPGQTSGLVKTTYGYHILQVQKHEQARVQPIEEARGQLTVDFIQRASSQQMQKLADQTVTELRKDPLHPEKAATSVGMMLIRADNIQAGDPIPGLGVAKELTDAVSGLRKGEVSAPVVLPGNKVVVASVTDYQPVRQASFEEASADARNKASQEKLDRTLAQKASELMSKAQAMGGDLEKAGKEAGIEVKTSADVDRQGTIENVGTASNLPDAFTKPAGSLFGPVTVPGGRVVAKVISRTPVSVSELPSQSASIRDELKQQKARDRAALFEEGLKKRLEEQGKLKIHQDVLSRVVQSYTTRT